MRQPARRRARAAAVALAALAACALLPAARAGTPAPPPASLRDTGLYADFATREIDPALIAYQPQYPLWTDGAAKRRWIALPPGTAIDASDPDHWLFPVGTRLWKEFAFGGTPVETRFIERTADGWLYAAYRWTADGSDAPLAAARGEGGTYPLAGGRSHAIPAVTDCRICHESGGPTPVLGVSLLQLSPDRDPGALHVEPGAPAADLVTLAAAGVIAGLPPALLATPPRIAGDPVARAALGYLHGNCGHCHNAEGPLARLGLDFRHTASPVPVEPGVATALRVPVARPAPGQAPGTLWRVAPGDPDHSLLAERIGSRWAALQMPPMGTELVDDEARALIRAWIAGAEATRTATTQAPQGGTRQ